MFAHTRSSFFCYSFLRGSFVLLAIVFLLSSPLSAQTSKGEAVLTIGKPVERELGGGDVHSYRILLSANQYLRAVVEQKGIDVVVTVFAPDGKQLAEVDSPNGLQGPEPVLLIADVAGSYRVEIRSLEKTAAAGHYEVNVLEMRAATPRDREAIAAATSYAEAELLREARTAESYRNAIVKYDEAIRHARAAGDRVVEVYALNFAGLTYDGLGEKKKAFEYYDQALPLARALGDHKQEAVILNNIGLAYDALGEPEKALDYYNQSLKLDRTYGLQLEEATSLSNIGHVYDTMGERQKALEYFNQSLPLSRAVGDVGQEATTLTNIGNAYYALGERQKALDSFNAVLPLHRAIGYRLGEATTLNNIGFVYLMWGESQKALDHFSQAMAIHHDLGYRVGEALALNNIGNVYFTLGEKLKALEYYSKALVIEREIGARQQEGSTLANMGNMYYQLDDKNKALDYYTQALAIVRLTRDRQEEGKILSNMGVVYRQLGQNQKAEDSSNAALPLIKSIGDRPQEALTLYNLATLEIDKGNLTKARERIEGAIAIAESLRTNIASSELRSSYFATVQQYYEFYIHLLMLMHKQQPTKGYDGDALQISERGRARSLLETLAEAHADIRQGVDAKLLDRERSLQQQLNAKAQQQLKLLNGNHTDSQVDAMARELDSLANQYQETEAQIRQTSPRYAALTQPQPLTLQEIQSKVLDRDTVLLEYSLGENSSFLWLVTQNSISSYELPNRTKIEDTVRQVYSLLSKSGQWIGGTRSRRLRGASVLRTAPAAAFRLSDMILAPANAQLGRKRLIVVADGALQFIPFAALPSPSTGSVRTRVYRPTILDHEIVTLPSASTLAVLRNEVKDRKLAPKTYVVLADPVFERNDERFKAPVVTPTESTSSSVADKSIDPTDGAGKAQQRGLDPVVLRSAEESGIERSGFVIPRLPGTRREAAQILAMVPAGASKQSFDFEANRKSATDPVMSEYRYVHFATHGLLDSQHPELTGILLSMFDAQGKPQDGFLRAHEIFNLRLNAEMVVLSACQTGLGKEVKGEGLIGLTRGFMYAGAPRVVVSLWNVSDQGTAELMARFYKGVLKDGMRPAQALQAAQASMLRTKRFSSPFYWAAFTLQGEWK